MHADATFSPFEGCHCIPEFQFLSNPVIAFLISMKETAKKDHMHG